MRNVLSEAAKFFAVILVVGGRFSLTSSGGSQVYCWSSFAVKPGGEGNVDGNGNAAPFDIPRGIAVDSNGKVYVADRYNFTIRKTTPIGGDEKILVRMAARPRWSNT